MNDEQSNAHIPEAGAKSFTRLSVPWVLSRSVSLILSSPGRFLIVTGFAMLPFTVAGLAMATALVEPDFGLSDLGLWCLLTLVDQLLAGPVAGCVIAKMVFASERGTPATISSAFADVVRVLPKVLGIGALSALAYTLGTLLCFVPVVAVATLLFMLEPVVIAETGGVIASFRRTVDLTRGNRLPILLLVLLFGGIASTSGLLIEVLLPHAPEATPGGYFLMSYGIGMLAWMVKAVAAAVAYSVLAGSNKRGEAIHPSGSAR